MNSQTISKTVAKSSKIVDTSTNVSLGSRADAFWKSEGFADYLSYVRPKFSLPKSLQANSSVEIIQNRFSIRDLNFGNWVTNEDRYNYVNSLIVCCYDLNKVVGFNYNIGFGYLAVAFGARGKGRAAAHYEPWWKIINITRYEDDSSSTKMARFIATGGMGAFAHEYGHYLDYFAGEFLDKSNAYFAVTGGRITTKDRLNVGGEIRKTADDILEAIIWREPNKTLSNYYKRLFELVGRLDDMGEYYLRRNEMFARWFEAWVSWELQRQGITNRLLAQGKYDERIYPTDKELEKVAPLFRRFCKQIKDKI